MSKSRFYAIIPARKKSKRIKNKNLILLKKKKLIEYTLENVLRSKLINKIYVNSDDKKIKIICENKNKINYVSRSYNNSLDSSTTESVILETIKKKSKELIFDENSHIILLQCTSPLREKNEIDQSIKHYLMNGFDSMFSGYFDKSLFWGVDKNKIKPLNYNLFKRKREQKMKAQIIENGSIYIFNLIKFLKFKNRLFGKIGFFKMDKINSFQIDEPLDLNIIERLIK